MRKPFALMSALMLSACVATPPTDPQVKPVEPADLGLAGAPAPQADADWWKVFRDPQVDRLAQQVMTANPTLTAALARMRAAQAALAASHTQDLPQLSLDGNDQRTLFSKNYIIPPPYAGTWHWYGTLGADLSWNLDFWGKQADLIARARYTADAMALDVAAARLALSGSFAQTYLDLLLNYQYGDIADEAVAERSEILKITQGRFDAGLENGSALAQAKVLLAQAKADQLRYAAARAADVHALAALAGEGANAYDAIMRPAPDLAVRLPLPDKLPADLLSRRPDVLAAKARVLAAIQGRDAARASFFPDINLTAMAGFQSLGLANLITGNSFTTGVGPAIHLPIFDAGRLKAQYASATADLDGAVADYNGAVVNAIQQTADAMTQVKSLDGQIAQQREAVVNAQKAFQIAEDRYRGGLDTQLPMLSTQAMLLQARSGLAALMCASTRQRITLLLTVGGSFTPSPDTTQIADKDMHHD